MADEEEQIDGISPGGSTKHLKPKLTKEEKAALAEQKYIESLAHAFRSQLAREIEYTNLSLARGNKKWVTMLTNIQMADMQQELKDWKVRVDRVFDRKNYNIKKMLCALDMAEEQHNRNQSMHTDMIDFLLMFCKDMNDSCTAIYEFEASTMIDIFYQECITPEAYAEYIRRYYENLYNCENLIASKVMVEEAKLNLEIKENIINFNIGRRYELRDAAVNKMNKLFNQLQIVFKEIESDKINLRPKDEYDRLMERQVFYAKELIRIQVLSEARQANVVQLQKKLVAQELDYIKKIKLLRQERAYFYLQFQEIKRAIKADSGASNDLLTELAYDCFMVVKKLRDILKFGEPLLSLALTCRKFQTEKEKVLRIPEPKIKMRTSINEIKHIDQSLINQMDTMSKFSRLASIGGSHVTLLKKERAKLRAENQKYSDMLKQVLEDAKSGLK